MLARPNETMTVYDSKQKNDLYRRFKDYFIMATEKEFVQFSHYGTNGYISANPMIEEKILDTMAHSIDEIVPITGATGIGKTYLLLYCLKIYYNTDDILTNHPMLLQRDGYYDLVYYSDFNITEPALLEKPTKLILAKIKAMYDRIIAHFDIKEFEIDQYIEEHKMEVKYYEKADAIYQKDLFKLTALLRMKDVLIKNIVFIFDDLESLDESRQFSLMKHFLILFENFKSKSERKYCSKFIFCLRSNTYYNIYRRDFYNTHRASKAVCLTVAPSLSQVFNKRFEVIFNSEQVQQAKILATWTEARDILIKICNRVDESYSNLLINLNNNNVSNALDDFLNIVSNRRWTQKNVNPAASFTINENHYYINDINILRILSMGEKNVYYQTYNASIRCILPSPGVDRQDDLICFLILRAFQFHNRFDMGDTTALPMFLSTSDVSSQLINCLLSPGDSLYETRKEHILKIVESAFAYYDDNRFIRKNIDPEIESEQPVYFMLPRGEQIFTLFFSQMILYTIFRDAFFANDKKYDLRCSCKMSFADLLSETIKYEHDLIELEIRLFNKITQNKMWRNYVTFWGSWSISERFLNGINKSVQQFYKCDPLPDNLRKQLDDFREQVDILTSVFESEFEENTIF